VSNLIIKQVLFGVTQNNFKHIQR